MNIVEGGCQTMPAEPQLEQPIDHHKIKAGLAQRRRQCAIKEEENMASNNQDQTTYTDRIRALIGYSRPLPDGSYKTVEMGAEASVGPAVDWMEAQAQLYADLITQFLDAWEMQVLEEPPAQPTPEPEAPPPAPTSQGPYCQEHRTPFQRYDREGQVWYSHRAPDSSWCRYREPNRGRR